MHAISVTLLHVRSAYKPADEGTRYKDYYFCALQESASEVHPGYGAAQSLPGAVTVEWLDVRDDDVVPTRAQPLRVSVRALVTRPVTTPGPGAQPNHEYILKGFYRVKMTILLGGTKSNFVYTMSMGHALHVIALDTGPRAYRANLQRAPLYLLRTKAQRHHERGKSIGNENSCVRIVERPHIFRTTKHSEKTNKNHRCQTQQRIYAKRLLAGKENSTFLRVLSLHTVN